MKLLPALVIANTLQWSFGKLRRIEQRPARQIQEYNTDSSPSSSGGGESSTAHDSDVGVLSIKEHQENAIRHLQQTECVEFVDCVEGYVKDSDPPEKCKYACGVPISNSTGGECCNRDSGVGDACEGFTGKVCKDKDTSTGFPGSCSGNDACKNANITSVFKSCDGTSSCKDAGSNNGPSGTTNSSKGYVGELVDSCVGSGACLGIGSDGGFIGKVTSSCRNTQACFGAGGYAYFFGGYGGGGTIGGIYDSCNDQQSCKLLGSKGGFVGKVTNSCDSGSALASLNCYSAAYGGGAIQEIYNSCNAKEACYELTNATSTASRQRMLAKKSKPPKEAKTPNPNKPPAPAPKPANPNQPEPNPNKPTPPPSLDPLVGGPELDLEGALCLRNCCTDPTCAGTYTQSELVAKGCPAECSGSITPWGA